MRIINKKLFTVSGIILLLVFSLFAISPARQMINGKEVFGSALFQEMDTDRVRLDQNVETLSANKTLVITDMVVQKLDPGGADRDVTLPAEASSTDLVFWILNMGNGAGEDLVIKNDAPATLGTLGPEMGCLATCDGTTWTVDSLIPGDGSLYVDGTSPRVGMGTVTPGAPLHVYRGAVGSGTALFITEAESDAGNINWILQNNGTSVDTRAALGFRVGALGTGTYPSGMVQIRLTDSTTDAEDTSIVFSNTIAGTLTASLTVDGDGDVSATANLGAATYGSDGTVSDTELLRINAITAFGESIIDDADEATFKATVNLEAGTDFYSVSAADAAFEAELDDSAGLAAALDDETGWSSGALAVFNIAPVFVTSLGIGSAILLETDLEIFDEAATEGLTHAELMYLKDFTGVSGSGALCGNIAPQLTTPSLGAATYTSLTGAASALPGWIFRDTGCLGTVKEIAKIYANALDGTDGAEYGGLYLQVMLNGSESTAVAIDAVKAEVDLAAFNLVTSGFIAGAIHSALLTTTEGAHDTGESAATLVDSGESWTVDAYIGMTLYNVTDGSSTTVTDNDGTSMTGTLSGGTDDDWDTTDVWAVAPGPKQSGSIWYISSATTILHPATVNYAACYFAVAAQVVKIDPQSGSMTINFSDDGVHTDPGAGDEIDGDGTQGDFICIHNLSATEAYSLGVNGSWADGGAS